MSALIRRPLAALTALSAAAVVAGVVAAANPTRDVHATGDRTATTSQPMTSTDKAENSSIDERSHATANAATADRAPTTTATPAKPATQATPATDVRPIANTPAGPPVPVVLPRAGIMPTIGADTTPNKATTSSGGTNTATGNSDSDNILGHPDRDENELATTTTTATGPGTLSYGGGAGGIGVTSGTPQVYLVFWGTQWGTQGTDASGNLTFSNDSAGGAPYLQKMFKGLGTNNETWSGVVTQYCDGPAVTSGANACAATDNHIGFPSGGVLSGVWYDNGAAEPSAASGAQIAAEAVRAASHFGNTTAASNRFVQYVILSGPGMNPDNYMTSGFCAWHSATYSSTIGGYAAYTNMPYVMDRGGSCGANFVNHTGGPLDGYSMVEGHEYAETITDQVPGYGWTNHTGSSMNGQENADECAWISTGQGASANLTLSTGTFAMQSSWSNDTNRCDFTHAVIKGAGASTVTINSPGAQSSELNVVSSLQMSASTTDAAATVSFSASGLPTGMTINATSGLISGKPTIAGTYATTVTATDTNGASAKASFTWVVATLGGTMTVDANTPGLASAITLTPRLPGAASLTKVTWKAGRADCTFTDANGAVLGATTTSVKVTCNASAAGSTTITAAETDSSGAIASVVGTLTFAGSAGSRTPVIAMTIDGQAVDGTSASSVCTNLGSDLEFTAMDALSGAPIKGLQISVLRATPTTTPALFTVGTTLATGRASVLSTLSSAYTYTRTAAAQSVWAAVSSLAMPLSYTKCTPQVAATATATTAWYGDSVTVSGTVARSVGNTLVGIAGLKVPVTVVSGTVVTTMATATLSTDVTNVAFSVTFAATKSGTIVISIPGTAGINAVSSTVGGLTVQLPTSAISGAVSATNVGYGSSVVVTGTLTKTTTTTLPVASAKVSAVVSNGTTSTVIGSATTAANGSFTITAPLRVSGTLSVTYAGGAGVPAAASTISAVTAGIWTPTITLSSSSTSFVKGTYVTLSGTATQTYNGSTIPAAGLVAYIYLAPATGATPMKVATVVTNAAGTYAIKVAPQVTGTLTAVVSGLSGYLNTSSPGVFVTVS